MKQGDKVEVTELRKTGNTFWAEQFVGQVGTIQAKCSIYGGALVVKFDKGTCSLYPDELKETK